MNFLNTLSTDYTSVHLNDISKYDILFCFETNCFQSKHTLKISEKSIHLETIPMKTYAYFNWTVTNKLNEIIEPNQTNPNIQHSL